MSRVIEGEDFRIFFENSIWLVWLRYVNRNLVKIKVGYLCIFSLCLI